MSSTKRKDNLRWQLSKLQCKAGQNPLTAKHLAKQSAKKSKSEGDIKPKLTALQNEFLDRKRHTLGKKVQQHLKKIRRFQVQRLNKKIKESSDSMDSVALLADVKGVDLQKLATVVAQNIFDGHPTAHGLEEINLLSEPLDDEKRKANLHRVVVEMVKHKQVAPVLEVRVFFGSNRDQCAGRKVRAHKPADESQELARQANAS
eukprot:c13513_g1_i1.p1 GENE.c13513_g1_i1~~c13513_g1_i1.p1  ORF type:complete len:214 (+),score=48.87 c13513_g1_i1:35-643(+)